MLPWINTEVFKVPENKNHLVEIPEPCLLCKLEYFLRSVVSDVFWCYFWPSQYCSTQSCQSRNRLRV